MTELDDDIFFSKKKNKRFKLLTFVTGILAILLAFAVLACVIFIVKDFIPMLSRPDGSDVDKLAVGILAIMLLPLMFVLIALCSMMTILYFVLGCFLIGCAFKEDRVFRNRMGFIIFTIVMDFFLSANLLFAGLTVQPMPVILVVVACVMLFSSILKIVDLSIFNRKLKTGAIVLGIPKTTTAANSGINLGALKEGKKLSVAEKLKKLGELKSSGLITQQDYQQMRKKTLDEM